MKEFKKEMFDLLGKVPAICLTTNGSIKSNGCCVMGRGCALTAKERWSGIDKTLGQRILDNGNITQVIVIREDTYIISFPVKHQWHEKADVELIKRSAEQLVELTNQREWEYVILPRPGCGNGKLEWKNVKPVLEPILDDRFYIVSK